MKDNIKLAHVDITRKQMEYLGLLLNPPIFLHNISNYINTENIEKVRFDITEKGLSEIMEKEPYKELKDYLQDVGKNKFNW